MCKDPYIIRGMAVPCTRCLPCRFNRRRMWSSRMQLESFKHSDSCFLTLTYDDLHLPSGGTLVPRDVQLFLKRLRKAIYPLTIRYFFVGEYGEETQRPHYHAALYGIGIEYNDIVKKAWGRGHVMLGSLTPDSAQYIAGYTVKKMTAPDDFRLNGRHPEFARMSLKPGIGALAVDDIARVMKSPYMVKYICDTGDIPNSLKIGSKALPLGRYIRRKIRTKLGLYDSSTGEIGQAPAKEILLETFKSELQALQASNEDYKNLSLKEVIINENKQSILNFETKTKIYNSKTRKVL